MDTESVRVVNLQPNRNWGGQGTIGCDILQGIIHAIPKRKQNLWSQVSDDDEEPAGQAKGAFNIEDIAQEDTEYDSKNKMSPPAKLSVQR